MTTGFAELVAASHFSFLHGASHPADMVGRAIELGLAGIGIADRNTVAGVVRAHVALRDARQKAKEKGIDPPDFKLVVGSRLVFSDGTPDIVAYPINRHGWGRLTRLLTVGNLRAIKGDCILRIEDLIAFSDDLLLIFLPESTATPQCPHPNPVLHDADVLLPRLSLVQPKGLQPLLTRLARLAPERVWLGIAMNRAGKDKRRMIRLRRIASAAGVPLLATSDALYSDPACRPLSDVLTCIRHGKTIATGGRLLQANAERHIKSAENMAYLFCSCPKTLEQTIDLLGQIDFTLDQLQYEYPHEPVPEGWQPLPYLYHLTKSAALERYGSPLPPRIRKMLAEEFWLIRKQSYACYFLTVYDLVRFARTQNPPILCQGRGSAANSIVCFLLGITSVDPAQHNLLFSRFVSDERAEPPDIDVDFEHERREEVMQYVYRRYGRNRAGIAATVIHYRPRSAVRDVGKALGLSEDVTTRLVSTVWGSFGRDMPDKRFIDAGFDPAAPEIAQFRTIVDRLLAAPFPRHLSQHVGGFVLTEDRLDETVPIHHAAMDDRSFIEWDKDDIDALGLMKVDVLALGMLTCIAKGFELMRQHGLGDHSLDVDISADDPAVYDMLCRGDSIGVFQVESRAQMNMLPRLRPRKLYDLTVQVAIVRPGPIEGDMVHPYLRRRAKEEPTEFPSPVSPHDPDELRILLGETYGVPIFQEQAMKLAIVAAGFAPSEANRLRRAMATFRNLGGIDEFRDKLVNGMTARGYQPEFAKRCFRQIEGFGSYGFPESHALSFARLVYVSAWMKYHQPAVFACALLNSQPMGFYAPAQIIRDASEHGVEIRSIDVNRSRWDNSIERDALGQPALRLGFRQIDGFKQSWANALVTARRDRSFTGIEQIARHATIPTDGLRLLADADAMVSLGLTRREALWQSRRTPTGELPLFIAMQAAELGSEQDAALPSMPLSQQVVTDYQMIRLSLKAHPMQFLRCHLDPGTRTCAQISAARNDALVRTAGLVLVRQRPGKGNAIFITIEDETGVTNILLWSRLFEHCRAAVMASRLMLVEGRVQRSREGVVHLMAQKVLDRSHLLDRLDDHRPTPTPVSRGDEVLNPQPPHHPRDVRLLSRSRDFH